MRNQVNSRREIIDLVVVMGVALVACVGLWNGPGILNTRAGGDSPFLLQRAFELAANLREGVFPARWMPDAAFGLGYPFFNYYAALPYYLAAGLNVAGVDLLVAIKLTQTVGMAAAGAAMWVWLRHKLPGVGASLAAIAYVLAPFHLANVYVRGDSLSEFYAFVFFPLILLGIERVVAGVSARAVAALGASVAGLVLTHNVSAMLFAPFCAIYSLAALLRPSAFGGAPVADRRALPGALARLALGVGAGLALSAWFWLPAIIEAGGAQLGDQTTGFFSYALHFRSADLVQDSFPFDYALGGAGNPFAMGLVQTLVIVAGILAAFLALRRHHPGAAFWVAMLGGLGLATFMITPLSEFVWRVVTPLSLAQFPWRLLSIQAVFAAPLSGLAAASFAGGRGRVVSAGLAVALAAAALSALPSDRLNVVGADVNRQSLEDYEWLSGNIGTTIRAEYLPAAVRPPPAVGPDMVGADRARALSGSLLASAPGRRGVALQEWDLSVGPGPAKVALPLLFWQGWEATAENAAGARISLALGPAPRLGWVSADIPEGQWRVVVRARPSGPQQAGQMISLLAMALAAAWLVFRGRRSLQRPSFVALGRGLAVPAGLLMVGLAITAFVPAPTGAASFVDYDTRPFPNRGPIPVAAENSRLFWLEGVETSPAVAKPGDLVTVTVRWRDGASPDRVSVEQFAPSHGLPGWPLSPAIARIERASGVFIGARATFTLAATTPAGPLVLRLLVEDEIGKSKLVAAVMGPRVVIPPGPGVGAPLRSFGPATPIELVAFSWQETRPGVACLKPVWRLAADGLDAPYALKYSLRLRAADGRALAQADQEPMMGLAPVWSWASGASIYDGVCEVRLAEGFKPGDAYQVEFVWYDAATGAEVARTALASRRLADPAAPQVADASWATNTP